MKISELIEALKTIHEEHGDLKVTGWRVGRVMSVTHPEVKHLRILSKRESIQDYWREGGYKSTLENKGEKVVSI